MVLSINTTEKLRNPGISGIVAVVVLLVVGTFIFVLWPVISKNQTNLALGDGVFRAELALNDTARQRGLSGRKSMNDDQALLMAFKSESDWGIWMKDMKFAIDIVWLDSDKKVVDLVRNVDPDESTDVIHKPNTATKYVVEFNAGTIDNKAIHIGNKANFQINSEIE